MRTRSFFWWEPDHFSGCWNSLLLLGHFAWHWARHCSDNMFCVLYIYSPWILQWHSHAERVLTLNINIQLPLFWNTCQGPWYCTCAGLAMQWLGSYYSFCLALEQSGREGLAILFPWIVKNSEKTVAQAQGLATLNPKLESAQMGWLYCFSLNCWKS